jgi:predicted nucleotidyltransferase
MKLYIFLLLVSLQVVLMSSNKISVNNLEGVTLEKSSGSVIHLTAQKQPFARFQIENLSDQELNELTVVIQQWGSALEVKLVKTKKFRDFQSTMKTSKTTKKKIQKDWQKLR